MVTFSIDLETNGLLGDPFIVSTRVYSSDGTFLESFDGRCPIEGEIDSFVKEHVLPPNVDIVENYSSLLELSKDFVEFYKKFPNKTVISHIPYPVESGYFLWLQHHKLLGEFEGPYPLIDVGSMLHTKGEDPTSLSSYLDKYGITVDVVGNDHCANYDTACAHAVYHHLLTVKS